jgi:serine/threonine protein kinase
VADLRELLKPGRRLEVTNPETGAVVRWTVQGLLQEGGRGLVFEVVDQDGRPAVLKGPSRAPGAAYSAIIEREILKKVSPHPSLVKYLGSSDEGGMPLVIVGWAHENPFLRLNASPAREKAGPYRDPSVPGIALPAPVAIEIVFDLVLALEHLHTNGFVHSDVKPANVMVEVDPTARDLDDADFFRAVVEGRTRAVLIDVGGARSESFLEDLNAGNVDPSIVPPELTPLWAPPEAVVGAETREGRRPIYSAAIDVYQAGLLFGTLLTGRAPYEHLADRYDRTDMAQLMELKAAEKRGELAPFPPGAVRAAPQDDVSWEVEGRSARPGFDDAVEAILAHTLARDSKERGTIGQLRMTMERAFDLFPNARARGGAAVAPTFRTRGRVTLKVENRLTAASTAGARSGMGSQIPADAAEKVLKMAAEVAGPRGAVVRATPPPRPTGSIAKPKPPAGPPLRPATTSQPAKPSPSGTGPRPVVAPSSGGTGAVELDRVLLRVNAKDVTKTFEVLSREGARSIEVEGGRFEFRIAPQRSCEVLRAALDAKVDVFAFERRKGNAPPGGK